jgi:hypothetical protein
VNWTPEFATAVATVVIAAFTIVLAVGGSIQAWLTRQAISLAREEFISGQRPKIVIRQIVIWQSTVQKTISDGEFVPFIADERFCGHLDLANIGATTATVEFFCGIFHCRESPLPMVPPYNKLEIDRQDPLVILKAGERRTLGGLYGTPLTMDIVFRISIGTARLYAMGWVRYTDDRKVARETRFCRLWDRFEHRFRSIDDPDYEYSE